jgi:steroid Delta-isomerase
VSANQDEIVRFYETLSPETLGDLRRLYHEDVRFQDPFNAVVGVDAIERIFRDMFERLDAPRFHVENRIVDGSQAMLAWTFDFALRGRNLRIHGVTHLRLCDDGRILTHRDYWDPAGELYAGLPVIGLLVRWLMRRLSAGAEGRQR